MLTIYLSDMTIVFNSSILLATRDYKRTADIKPFPTYSKSAADDFENDYAKIWKISIIVGTITGKSWKHWQKVVLSNFSFCHNVFKSRLLQMRQNASIGRKGLKWDCWNMFFKKRRERNSSSWAISLFLTMKNIFCKCINIVWLTVGVNPFRYTEDLWHIMPLQLTLKHCGNGRNLLKNEIFLHSPQCF